MNECCCVMRSDKMSLWCGFLRIKRFITGKDEKIIINVGISRKCMVAWST